MKNYSEEKKSVMEYLVEHSIYKGSMVRTKIEDIVQETGLSNCKVNKILKTLKEEKIITGSLVKYIDLKTRKGGWIRKTIGTEFLLNKKLLWERLDYDMEYDPQHVDFKIEDFSGLPFDHSISKSNTTESVYVKYRRTDTHAQVEVRFSNHKTQLREMYVRTREQILKKLGFKIA